MHPILQQLEQNLIHIKKGSFMMGSEEGHEDEKPVHQVTFEHDFYMSKYPVTQVLWEAIMGENPSHFQGANRPVENVSWDDTKVFFEKLNNLEGNPYQYRLPSEAEWEYAARGGSESKGFKYAGSHILKEVAWYNKNSHSETKSVGLKLPNDLGLYDMSGNVWEWCADRWHDSYENAPNDGSAWLEGESEYRVCRGGSWIYDFDDFCRVACRYYSYSFNRDLSFGFRVTRY